MLFWRYIASNMLGLRPWSFGVTWCRRSRDDSTRGGPLPVGGPLWPRVYLAPLWGIWSFKRWTDARTDALVILYSIQCYASHWTDSVRGRNTDGRARLVVQPIRTATQKEQVIRWCQRRRALKSRQSRKLQFSHRIPTDRGAYFRQGAQI